MSHNLALLLLALPLLTQAGPVSFVDTSHGYSTNLSNTLVEPSLKNLITRGNDVPSCKEIKTCLKTGQDNWNALIAKLKDDSAKDVDQYDDTFKKDYKDIKTPGATPDAAAFKDVFQKDLHLDFSGRFAEHVVSSKEGTRDAFVNMYNTNQGTLVDVYNYKDQDPTQSVPFSEIVFQCYKDECDDLKELKKFQFAGVCNVGNTEYLELENAIFKKHDWQLNHKDADEWKHWTYKDNRDDFLAFLGTPKIGYILRMLADHSKAFGKRIPTDVYTRKRISAVYVLIDEYKG
ncbi:MAG: hypothetical protein Q9180_006538 [Flavoplaca navasiana]